MPSCPYYGRRRLNNCIIYQKFYILLTYSYVKVLNLYFHLYPITTHTPHIYYTKIHGILVGGVITRGGYLGRGLGIVGRGSGAWHTYF